MLTAAFTPRMRAYERRVGRIDEMKLVVLAIDSLHLGVQTPSNHDTLKRTFSSKISRSGVVCTVVSSSDAMPCWIGCLAASVSPANTDERLGELYMRLNSQGLNGGLLDLLTGPTTQGQNQIAFHDFFTILLMDKGYRGYGRHVAGSQTLWVAHSPDLLIEGRHSFRDALDQLVVATNGRFSYELPPDNRDSWKDKSGHRHAPPQPIPGMVPAPPDLQLDLTASSGSVGNTFSWFSLH